MIFYIKINAKKKKADTFTDSRYIFRRSRNSEHYLELTFHYLAHRSPPLGLIFQQNNLFDILTRYTVTISADNTHPSLVLKSTIECLTVLKTRGSIKVKNGRRIRTNDEIQVMSREPNIATTVKVRKPELAGHLVRYLMIGP